jgi:hypothetical protein
MDLIREAKLVTGHPRRFVGSRACFANPWRKKGALAIPKLERDAPSSETPEAFFRLPTALNLDLHTVVLRSGGQALSWLYGYA